MPRPGPRWPRQPRDYNAGPGAPLTPELADYAQQAAQQGPETLSVRQVARMLGIHENTVRNWAVSGQLTDVRIPGSHSNRFLRSQVEAMLRNRQAAAGRHPRVELDVENIQPGDPFYLFLARPGEVWHWQPALPHASELVTVLRCWWNGEEWWVKTRSGDGQEHLNELSNFLRSAVVVTNEKDER
jgi:excisionase family DNA binding protein